MSVRFLIIVDGIVENVVVAKSAECLADFPGAVLQTEDLADVCLGWRFENGVFNNPYAPSIDVELTE